MDEIKFVVNYDSYLTEIEQVVKPEYLPAIERLRELDPHDLANSESWFDAETDARGYVWALFLKEKNK